MEPFVKETLTDESSFIERDALNILPNDHTVNINRYSIRTYLCLRVISLLLDIATLIIVIIAEVNDEGSPWSCMAIAFATLFDFIEVAALRSTFHGVQRSISWERTMIVADVVSILLLIPIVVSIVAPGSSDRYWIAQLVLVLVVISMHYIAFLTYCIQALRRSDSR